MLTAEFMSSRFYEEVFKPIILFELSYASNMSRSTDNPTTCFMWVQFMEGLRKILYEYMTEWATYEPPSEDDEVDETPSYGG
jgi:hypothetical protein